MAPSKWLILGINMDLRTLLLTWILALQSAGPSPSLSSPSPKSSAHSPWVLSWHRLCLPLGTYLAPLLTVKCNLFKIFFKQTLQEDFSPLKSRYSNDSPTQYVSVDESLNIFSLFSHLENEGTRLRNRMGVLYVLDSLFLIPQGSGGPSH